jgi:hypothetical protein
LSASGGVQRGADRCLDLGQIGILAQEADRAEGPRLVGSIGIVGPETTRIGTAGRSAWRRAMPE